MKKILLLALIVLVYQGQNKAALPALPLPIPPSSSMSINHTSSMSINHMIALVLAFGSGYKTATIHLNQIQNYNAPVIPYVLKALSAGLISVVGLGFLGKESRAEEAFYLSTFFLGAFIGVDSLNSKKERNTTQTELNAAKNQLNTTQTQLDTTQRKLSITQKELRIAKEKIYTLNKGLEQFKKVLTLYQDNLPLTVTEPDELSEYEQTICVFCQCPLIDESEVFLIKLKCGHVFHQFCINEWVAQKPSCPLCHRCLIEATKQSL